MADRPGDRLERPLRHLLERQDEVRGAYLHQPSGARTPRVGDLHGTFHANFHLVGE